MSCFNWDKKTFELIMAEIGCFINHKGLFYYANGKSEVLRDVVKLVKESKVPVKDQLAVAIKIVDRKSNGDVPSWSYQLLNKKEREMFMFTVFEWYSRLNVKNIYKAYKHMNRASLDRYNHCIAQIDRVNLGHRHY